MIDTAAENILPTVDWQNIVQNDHPMIQRNGLEPIVPDCILVGDCWDFTGTGVQRATFINCRLEKPITMVFPDGFHGACFEGLVFSKSEMSLSVRRAGRWFWFA